MKKILQNMSNMIQEVEDYMLDLNCIELRPEYIYEDSKGEIQWIYFPQTSLESEIKSICKIENSKIKTRIYKREWKLYLHGCSHRLIMKIQMQFNFMYRFYNKVRKLGFSKELLEDIYPNKKEQKEIMMQTASRGIMKLHH